MIKLKEVIKRYNSLAKLSQKKLPIKIGYAVSKNLTILQEEYRLIEESRVNILKNYAEKDEKGNPIIENGCYQLGDSQSDFNKEYQDYLETDIDIETYQIEESELDKLDDGRYDILTASELLGIEFLFKN